jgi:hypothetical protein
MAGSLDDYYNLFMGQTNSALNQQEQPWQQELMASVNPDKVRKDNIRMALAQASQAMATTPGNFLTGLSAAAGAGANTYLQAKQGAEEDRMKAMQLVELANQKQQDRRLDLLMGAIGVNRDLKADERDEEYNQARVDYYKKGGGRRGGSQAAGGLSDNQIRREQNFILSQLDRMRTRLEKDGGLSAQEIDARIDAEQRRLERIKGITLDQPEDWTTQSEYFTENDTGGSNENVSQFDFMSGGAQPDLPDRSTSKASPQGSVTPPRRAVEALRKNPDLRAQFEAKYGQGSADRYLGN